MKLVETLVAHEDDVDIIEAHVGFHVAVGVDLVFASANGETREVLSSHERVRLVDGGPAALWRAAADAGADWVLEAEADEFWWPRGESLTDPLVVMPPRYGVVQGLVRIFPPQAAEGPWAERLTRRPSLAVPEAEPEPLERALRPLRRAGAATADGGTRHTWIPLRAWYPFEVLRFPLRSAAQAERRFAAGREPRSRLEDAAAATWREGRLAERFLALAETSALVEDVRLRDALARLDEGTDPGLGVPDLVDDAAYAVECAAVGEVDLPRLEGEVAELEARVAWLEQRLWPRVLRQAARLLPGR